MLLMDELIDRMGNDIDSLVLELFKMERRGDGIMGWCSDARRWLNSFMIDKPGDTNIGFIRSLVQQKNNRAKIVLVMTQVRIQVDNIKKQYGTSVDPAVIRDYNQAVDLLCGRILSNIDSLLQLIDSDSDFRASLQQIHTTLIKLSDS